MHQYRFYTVAIDSRGNREAPALESEDIVLARQFAAVSGLSPIALDVQNGTQQRSFVRMVDIYFNQPHHATLEQLILQNRIRLERFGLNTATPVAGQGTNVNLSGVLFSLVNNRIRLDFGSQGIGGTANTNAGDGFYQLSFDINADGQFNDARLEFFRAFGDVNGDGQVNGADVDLSRAYFNAPSFNPNGDTNGDENINGHDLLFVNRESRLNKRLHANLYAYLDD